jgi:thiol-disulfide isomerase/thioredoxin
MELEEVMRASIGPVLVMAVLAAGCDRRVDPAGQGKVAQGNAAQAAAVSSDEVQPGQGAAMAAGTIDRSHKGTAAPAYAFQDSTGKTVTLAAFRGTPVLLNLWATWCGPCVKELPTLDALARREGASLHVVALSQDTEPAKVAPFMAAHGLKTLQPFTDAKMAWLPAVTANLPTTLLFDSAGKEVWRTTGDLDWTGAAATKALAEAR